MTMELGLKDKRVVITGAAGGLGRALAQGYANAGAHVLAADLDLAQAQETAKLANIHTAPLDVTDMNSCARCAERAVQYLGGIDILVNNAAIYGTLTRSPFEHIDPDEWDRVMAVNVKGAWQMSKAVVPALRATGGGVIVNVASATVFSGSPEWMHYVASKGAMIAMGRVMARELGPDNIRVNSLAPGVTMTEASHGHFDDATAYGANRAALGRNAAPADIVGAALCLASPLMSYTTGQTIVVDGGKQFV